MWPLRNSLEPFRFGRLTALRSASTVKCSGARAMSKFAPSITRWGTDEFTLRVNELIALVVSLFLMAGIAALAFVACAILQ